MELLLPLRGFSPGAAPLLRQVLLRSRNKARAPVVHEEAVSGKMGEDSLSSEDLLGAISHSDDASAFTLLFERYAGRIYQAGMQLTRNNEQLSRDLVQETMLTVWRKAGQFDLDRGSADNWIFTITRNRCFDLLRKVKREPISIGADDIWPMGEDVLAQPQNPAEQGALLSRIGSLLAHLPEQQQAVVRQVYALDCTHQEAARELGIPLGTLKSRLRLGLDKLKHLAGVRE